MTKQDIATAIKTAAAMLKAGVSPQEVAADLARLAKDLSKGVK